MSEKLNDELNKLIENLDNSPEVTKNIADMNKLRNATIDEVVDILQQARAGEIDNDIRSIIQRINMLKK